MRSIAGLEDRIKQEILVAPHPRFIWGATLRLKDAALMEVLFDATGIARSLSAYRIVWRNPQFASRLLTVFKTAALNDLLIKTLGAPLHSFIRESLEQDQSAGQRNLKC